MFLNSYNSFSIFKCNTELRICLYEMPLLFRLQSFTAHYLVSLA